MDYHNYSLSLFESFQRYQDELEADHLLKLQMEPSFRWYVEAKLDGHLQWTEWAYDERERDQLVDEAEECGFTYTVEEHN